MPKLTPEMMICEHEWKHSQVVIDTLPELYTRYCVKCRKTQHRAADESGWRADHCEIKHYLLEGQYLYIFFKSFFFS